MDRSKFYLTHLFYCLVSLFATHTAYAQSTERLSLNYHQLGEANDVSVSGVSGTLSHRLYLDKDGSNLLTFGLQMSQTSLKDETLNQPDISRELKRLVPQISLLKILNEKYSLVLSLRPGFYGEFKGRLADEFRLEGGLVVTRLMTDDLTLGLGLARGTNFGRDLIVPLLQFLYFATDQIVIRGLLPARASAWYIPSQKWEFGALFKLQGSLYNLRETSMVGAKRLGLADAQLGLAARYKIFGNNFIAAEAGYTLLRRYLWDDKMSHAFISDAGPIFSKRNLDQVPYLRIGFLQKF